MQAPVLTSTSWACQVPLVTEESGLVRTVASASASHHVLVAPSAGKVESMLQAPLNMLPGCMGLLAVCSVFFLKDADLEEV